MKNVAFIIPTGIGCTIGGHAGDATPAARLIGEVCDNIILNPNVVNASDINEMPHNAMYVEGSILDTFLEGDTLLFKPNSNRIAVCINSPVEPQTINAVNAAVTALGLDTTIITLRSPLTMKGWVDRGVAHGSYDGVDSLIKQLCEYGMDKFDAIAIASPIDVAEKDSLEYFKSNKPMVNPWGKVESMVSRKVAETFRVPVAHAPVESSISRACEELMHLPYTEVVDRRKAAEVLSAAYIHCILKGLHKAPRLRGDAHNGISRESLSCLVTPYGCIGRPHKACLDKGIPVIAVKENNCAFDDGHPDIIVVENYLEAAGMVACIHAGIKPDTVLCM